MTQLNRPASPILGTLLAGLTLVAAQAASGAPAAPSLPAERVKVLQAVVDCRKLTADAERLACFDRATAVLDEAEKTGAVVVVDQARVPDGTHRLIVRIADDKGRLGEQELVIHVGPRS